MFCNYVVYPAVETPVQLGRPFQGLLGIDPGHGLNGSEKIRFIGIVFRPDSLQDFAGLFAAVGPAASALAAGAREAGFRLY